MRKYFLSLILLGAASFGAQATTVEINPAACDETPPDQNCWTTAVNGGHDHEAFSQLLGLDLLYKAESADALQADPGKDEEGSLAGSYSTMFVFDTEDEYTGAMITYDGGSIVDCSISCYLVVKDGNHSPARYLFDLALSPFTWDGVMKLNLSGFWPGSGTNGSFESDGSISHIALYGDVSPIPVPAAFWLFGTALVGFIGIARRRSV